ncbi:MAG: Ldh family oxidoreductase [Bacillota bacterium]|nr:Ldh family oxidoreductase [Bacillota bacterium]
MIIAFEELKDQVGKLFSAAGYNEKNADIMANVLVKSEARGIYSHGVNLSRGYIDACDRKIVHPNPDIKIISESPSTVIIDGDRGMGGVVVSRAVEIASEKAKETGACTVCVRNAYHYGAGGYYATLIAERDMVGYLYANTDKTAVPFGGAERYLGTNPYSFGAPAGENPPFVLDMATTQVPLSKAYAMMREGVPFPEGIGVDSDGSPSVDPQKILNGGALCHFGGIKGYGLAFMINVVSGVLSGCAYKKDEAHIDFDQAATCPTVGFFLNVTDIAHLMEPAEFRRRMDDMIAEMKTLRRAPGVNEIFYPGEIEGRKLEKALKYGVNISDKTYGTFLETAKAHGLLF